MRFINTLSKVARQDGEAMGFRAADLAVLKEKGFNIPLTFVVNNEAFEEFMAENGLKGKIERIILEKPNAAESYQEIMALFAKSNFPKDLQAELIEAHDSLGVEGSSATSLIQDMESPFLTLTRSPGYLLGTEDEEGILQNVKGQDQFFIGLKLIWSTLYSPDSKDYRNKAGISENFGVGVIVQKMKKAPASAVAYSRTEFNQFMIRIKSFKGYMDYLEPITGKDVHDVDVNSLLIRNSQVNIQEYGFERDIESEEMTRRPLLGDADKQKLSDKTITEVAKVTKRAKSFIGKDIKLYLSVSEDAISVLQVNRMLDLKKVEETESIEITQDDQGKTTITETQIIEEKKPSKLEMPTLLSTDEAKEHIMKEMSHKVFSLEGFTEPEPVAAEDLPAVAQTVEAAKIKEEESLLDEVLKIKEVLEKMESHAYSKNKEEYEKEARQLRDLLRRLND
jgi:phosphoenolpyruvate synthase/pyruvate phosphate dikinase